MKLSSISLIIAFALVVLVPISAQAEPVGTAFTYQGRLDDNGSPVTGTYDFRFMLYDAIVDGTQQGITVIKENVQVTNGIFTLEIDPANGDSDVFDENARWLEISLRDGASTGSFSILSPRQRLTPAPYAVHSISGGGGGGGIADLALDLQCTGCVSAAETDFYESLFNLFASRGHMHSFEDLTVDGTLTVGTRLDVNGPVYQRGSLLHADYVFHPGYKLESVEEHARFMWENKHLAAIPERKLDSNGQEIVEIGSHQRGIVEELEKAHIYIEQLHKENKELQARLAKLEARLDAMKSPAAESSLQKEKEMQ